MKKNRNVISEVEEEYKGETVLVKKLKPKNKKLQRTSRKTTTTCPNCMSSLFTNDVGAWECSGDRLVHWESEFFRYNLADEKGKVKTLATISDDGRFLELFDRWVYCQDADNEEVFSCGYSNAAFSPNGGVKVNTPDPIFTKKLENKLGRKLTEEELLGEEELFWYNGMVLTKYRKNAKKITIPFVVLPSEETIYPK
jgi:hypothetical protein